MGPWFRVQPIMVRKARWQDLLLPVVVGTKGSLLTAQQVGKQGAGPEASYL